MARVRRGDLWALGEHRLLCGDATQKGDVERLLQKEKPLLMVTDPPYGVHYDPRWRDVLHQKKRGSLFKDDRIDWTEAFTYFPGNICYVWHAAFYSHRVAEHLEGCGFKLVNPIIWVKHNFALSRGDYHWQHEVCWYAVRKGEKHRWQGARDQSTVWKIATLNHPGFRASEGWWNHRAQKPLECMVRPIRNNSEEGEMIYDPFGGTGTTLIACEQWRRRCYMMEIEPNYCEVILKRWEKESGRKSKKIRG
ncbi:MAG: site-specific DNA-methyltransferase [Deltaproteobacteria bacterium]|nr:site-specific DNA-methyltransferase [Deltaproteobacteria bacterium]